MIRSALAAAAMAVALPAAAQEEALPPGWALKPVLDGLDQDGDGLYSPEEIGGTQVPPEFDLDGDGLFSIVELSQGYWARIDADRSGYLEPGELDGLAGLPAMGVYTPEL